ncbi:hypothetical protein, partial [Pseudomonas sp. SIMBA_021]|uniref:hypothetical protein n=1 Tax=Pseudomonas sp. SIMBA_021 TaxID=3085767 RepID=UPI00397BA5B7
RTVEIGELTAIVSVKTTTSSATSETDIRKSAAIVDSSGAIMKPSVPIAKVPSARNIAGTIDPLMLEDSAALTGAAGDVLE